MEGDSKQSLDEVLSAVPGTWQCVRVPGSSWQTKFILRLLQGLSSIDTISVSIVCVSCHQHRPAQWA